jgi:hypothetical protein
MNFDDALWVNVGIRVDEDGVNYREDRRGGTDSQGEGEDGCDGEPGAFAEFAGGVAEVGEYGVHWYLDARESVVRLELGISSEVA